MTKEEQREFIKHIEGGIDELEIDLLADYATKIPENGIVLDIGTLRGKSSFSIAMGSHPSVKIHTVDPIEKSQFFTYRTLLGFDDRIIYYKSKSQDLGEKWNLPLDMIFIDGDHSYQSVCKDIELFVPWVKKDGWCLFDDYMNRRETAGKAIDEGERKYYMKEKIFNLFYIGKKL